MSYCETGDVVARAGRMGKAWTDTSTPSFDDVERFIRTRAAEIDAALAGRGIAVPLAAGSTSAEALRSLNAAGALVLLLHASALGTTADAVRELLERVTTDWDAGLQAIHNGTHSAVVALEATDTGDSSADDFWSHESDYGEEGWTDPNDNPYLAPEFQRGSVF